MRYPAIESNKAYFAVIDTETTWSDKVMSIGIAIAYSSSFELIDKKYYIITPECRLGGMYSCVLDVNSVNVDLEASRSDVIRHISDTFRKYDIKSVFAYNAIFDYKHLPEMQKYMWFDIMKLAAYKQYNKMIPENAECYGTGRLKRNYGVEPILRMLTENNSYREVHNALCDAVDELEIMKLLGYSVDEYGFTQIIPMKE